MKMPSNAAAVAAACIFKKSFPKFSKESEGKSKKDLRLTNHKDVRSSSTRIPHWIARPLIFLALWLQHHFKLMTSGDTPHLDIQFSSIVALSSFLYLGVSYCFWIQNCKFAAALFLCITITSLISDSIDPASKFWCGLDRIFSTLGVYVGPLRSLFLTTAFNQRFQIIFLFIFSLAFLTWSRNSVNQSQFVLRHTLWHVVSACCLTWLALNFGC